MTNSRYEDDDHYSNDQFADFKPRDFGNDNSVDFDFGAMVAESEQRIQNSIINNSKVILTSEDIAKIEEIRYLNDTALSRALNRDGHSKSSEGSIEINLGNYWDRQNCEDSDNREIGISIYAYVLGTKRSHWFASIDRALETVRFWYAKEMNRSEYSSWD